MKPNQDFSRDTYQTGSTCPPKSRGGLVAFLLVLVIFLCGVSTVLGLMNIHLFRALTQQQETTPVAFSGTRAAEYTEDVVFPGFAGREVPELWSAYQDIPQGIYITEVTDATGIQPGDILLQVEGEQITATARLQELLGNKKSVTVVLYRNGQTLETSLTMDS